MGAPGVEAVGGVGGEPFETKEKEVLVLGEDSATSSLPPGVMAGLKTMRELERALITVQPAKAFGATGDASRGVPPESVVAYEAATRCETMPRLENRIGFASSRADSRAA